MKPRAPRQRISLPREADLHDFRDVSLLRDGPFPLLLAITDDDVADAAIRVTDALAHAHQARPVVLQVFDPTPYAPPPLLPTMMSLADAMIGPAATAERRNQVAQRLHRVCKHAVTWPIVSRLGSPAACIADEAHERHSQLLVLGLHHHGTGDRILGEETTVHVLANAGVAVFGVTETLQGLPKKVIIGVDFGHSSTLVARLAMRLVQPAGQVVLTHVQSPRPKVVGEDSEGIEVIHKEGIIAAFAKLVEQLTPPPGVTVSTELLTGDPSTELIRYAERVNPDLIAVASQRHPFIARLLLGSVSRRIIRDGRWSVLVTPPY